MTRIKGFDTSRHNHAMVEPHPEGLPIDFVEAFGDGFDFWAGRASVGDYYTDPWWERDCEASEGVPIVRMGYHAVNPLSAFKASVERFINNVRGKKLKAHVLDCELIHDQTPARIQDCVGYHVDALRAEFPDVPVIIYTNYDYLINYLQGKTFGCIVWISWPAKGNGMNPQDDPPDAEKYGIKVYQRSYQEPVAGVPRKDNDYDEWLGTQEEFAATFGKVEEPPDPDPEPGEPGMTDLTPLVNAIEVGFIAVTGAILEQTLVLKQIRDKQGGATEPPTQPPAQEWLAVRIERDPQANAYYEIGKNTSKYPIMSIYPTPDKADIGKRIQFGRNTMVTVYPDPVRADGAALFWKLAPEEHPSADLPQLYLHPKDVEV